MQVYRISATLLRGEEAAVMELPYKLRRLPLWKDKGQGLAEYALTLSLISLVVIVAVRLLGVRVDFLYQQIMAAWP